MPRCQLAVMQNTHNFDAVNSFSVVHDMADNGVSSIVLPDILASCSVSTKRLSGASRVVPWQRLPASLSPGAYTPEYDDIDTFQTSDSRAYLHAKMLKVDD